MTTLNPQIDAPQSQDEELARLRAEVAAWRARFAESKTRDLAFVNSGGEVPALFTPLERCVLALPQVSAITHVLGDKAHVVTVSERVRPAHVLGAARGKPRAPRNGDAREV